MMSKCLIALAVLLAITQTPASAAGQSSNHPANNQTSAKNSQQGSSPNTAATKQAVAPASTTSMAAPGITPDCESGNCDEKPSHITIATPAPAPAPWPVQDRIRWGAEVLLALLGYAGIMVAIQTLKKIERQGRYAESAAEAAAKSADAAVRNSEAALLHAQAIINAERPWILITIVPSRSIENGFTVIATNRGRGPAQVIAAIDDIKIAVDEAHLPPEPEYKPQDSEVPFVSIILLPGEFMNLKSFCRDDVKPLCGSDDAFRRIENWEERVFLHGKVTYRDLAAPADMPAHETGWCCRYIHGRQKSGLVMAGSHEYNVHT